MHTSLPSEEFRKIADRLDEITKKDSEEGDAESSVDKAVSDVMTQEKEPEKLAGSVNVESLAKDLGINDIAAFKSAFSSLKQGKMPTNKQQVMSLAAAFDKLLAADASTTSRVLSKLRQIHKAND